MTDVTIHGAIKKLHVLGYEPEIRFQWHQCMWHVSIEREDGTFATSRAEDYDGKAENLALAIYQRLGELKL